MIQAAATLSRDVGKKAACEAMEVSRAAFYRHLNPPGKPQASRPRPPLALSQSERQTVLSELYRERFQDKAPLEVYATLLDDGRYLCEGDEPARGKRWSTRQLGGTGFLYASA